MPNILQLQLLSCEDLWRLCYSMDVFSADCLILMDNTNNVTNTKKFLC